MQEMSQTGDDSLFAHDACSDLPRQTAPPPPYPRAPPTRSSKSNEQWATSTLSVNNHFHTIVHIAQSAGIINVFALFVICDN